MKNIPGPGEEIFIGEEDITPYLTNFFGVSESLGAMISLIKSYGLAVYRNCWDWQQLPFLSSVWGYLW
nr:hypothetical protein [uncultured Blautia sp.]